MQMHLLGTLQPAAHVDGTAHGLPIFAESLASQKNVLAEKSLRLGDAPEYLNRDMFKLSRSHGRLFGCYFGCLCEG